MVYITASQQQFNNLSTLANVPAVTSPTIGLNGNFYIVQAPITNNILYDGSNNSIISFSSNEDFDLFYSIETQTFPLTYFMTLLNDKGNVLFNGNLVTGNSGYFLGKIEKGRVYLLSNLVKVTGAASNPGVIKLFAKQTATVKKYVPNGMTASLLSNCVTTYDIYLQPTFTFTNANLIIGTNYNLSFGYEPIQSGSFNVVCSNPLIASTPEFVNFSTAVSFVYAFQALVTGTFSFTITFSFTNVGTSNVTDLTFSGFSGILPPLNNNDSNRFGDYKTISRVTSDCDSEEENIQVIEIETRRKR